MMETLSDQKIDEIKKEIEKIVTEFLNPDTLSYDTHTALRANVDGFVNAGDGKIMFTDYDSYKDAMRSAFDSFESFIEMKATQVYVYVLSANAAVCTTEFKGKILSKEGDDIIHNGCWTFVFKKFNGGWKVIHENGTHTHQ